MVGDVAQDLDEARTGIVFLTPENVASPWMHFEAGALAKAVGSRQGSLFTYVYGFDPGKLNGPLSTYQSTVATREDTRRLLRDLCVRWSASRRRTRVTPSGGRNSKRRSKIFRRPLSLS